MQWSDEAIILSSRKHGETSAVVRVFAASHGVYAGVVKGASSKANRGIVQPGNIVSVTWNARLSEHLGMWKAELLEPVAAHVMHDAMKLAALSSACTLIESAMPERHPYAKLYGIFREFLHKLKEADDWQEDYVRLELSILAESGFGLDLAECAATGTTENLTYVSPKSGRAVSAEAGAPYKEKMLPLPEFLLFPSPVRGEGQGGGKFIPKTNKYGSQALIPNAKELRTNMTEAEKNLWYHLRAHRFDGYKFRRQHPLSKNYIADFICLEKKLVIELDGGQHTEQQTYDQKRTAFFEQQGYKVLRFWNNEVLENMDGVLTIIAEALNFTSPVRGEVESRSDEGGGKSAHSTHPLPDPPPERGREITDGLALTGYFLEHWLLSPHNRKLPAARGRLIQSVK